MIGLPDSSKGLDEDFLVITGNWQNPILSCPLIPGVLGLRRFLKLPSFFFFFFFIPLKKKTGVQILHLVTPLSDPLFVPSTQPSEVGFPIVHFPSLFDLSHQLDDEMSVQRRTIDIGVVLGTSVPQSSEPSSLHPPPGFSQGEDVRRKRKRGEEDDGEDEDQEELPLTEPLKNKSPFKKSKSKLARAL